MTVRLTSAKLHGSPASSSRAPKWPTIKSEKDFRMSGGKSVTPRNIDGPTLRNR
ncbi:Uncharacterised protein [Mycobacteroides abscessus subsp. abscessus]|nr:Uncharacterised protein [Mycobacteroides abscessus subsp. abscessus]